MSNIRHAYSFEREAHHRYGVYNRPPHNIARIPCSYAADMVEHWKTQIIDRASAWPRGRQRFRQHALRLFKQLQHCGGSLPGYQLAPWAADRFSGIQREIAEVVDNAMWTSAATRRNRWIATPGQIRDEMETTKTVVEELAQAIYKRYRKSYLDAHEAAFEEFKETHGRYAGDSDTEEIVRRISAKTGFQTTEGNLKAKTYEPKFVNAWDRFYMEWRRWYDENEDFWSRMWGGTWDKAVEYRERALQWRRRFEELDPKKNALQSPEPTMPTNSWDRVEERLGSWLKWGAVAAVGLVVAPPLIKVLTRDSDD